MPENAQVERLEMALAQCEAVRDALADAFRGHLEPRMGRYRAATHVQNIINEAAKQVYR